MLHDLIVIVPQKTIAADAKALKWAADPHAEVFFATIADIIREIENPEQWLKNNQKQPPLSPPVTAENHL